MNLPEYSLNKFHTVHVLDILICNLQGTMYMYVSVRTFNLLDDHVPKCCLSITN